MNVSSEKRQTYYLHWKTIEARKCLSFLKSLLCKMSQICFLVWRGLRDEFQACNHRRCFVEQSEQEAAMKVENKYVWSYQSVPTRDRQSQDDPCGISDNWTSFPLVL